MTLDFSFVPSVKLPSIPSHIFVNSHWIHVRKWTKARNYPSTQKLIEVNEIKTTSTLSFSHSPHVPLCFFCFPHFSLPIPHEILDEKGWPAAVGWEALPAPWSAALPTSSWQRVWRQWASCLATTGCMQRPKSLWLAALRAWMPRAQ